MKQVAQILAWTLVNSLWIAPVIWLIVTVISSLISQSRKRRIVKISGLLLFTISVVVVLMREIPSAQEIEQFWTIDIEPIFFLSSQTWLDQIKIWVDINGQIISTIWLFGTMVGVLRFINNRHSLHKHKASAIACSDNKVLELIHSKKVLMRISRDVKVMVSSLIQSPMTTGVIKPIVYLPVGFVSGFSETELDAILTHELAHIKRHDYLINLFLVIIETTFFFNPIVHLLVRDLRKEMEYTCDDESLAMHDQITYAKALVKLQEITISNQVVLAAKNNQSEFKSRIERMINSNNKQVNPKMGIMVVLFITFMISSAFVNSNEVELPDLSEMQDEKQEVKQDTLWIEDTAEFRKMLKEKGDVNIKGKIVMVNGKRMHFILGTNKAMENAKKMMAEIQSELMKDKILNENKQKVTLMFQYSDVLNGKSTLGEHYEKYKNILNKYFPRYDSFATTRVFRYKPEN